MSDDVIGQVKPLLDAQWERVKRNALAVKDSCVAWEARVKKAEATVSQLHTGLSAALTRIDQLEQELRLLKVAHLGTGATVR